jgi:hypothetical protein
MFFIETRIGEPITALDQRNNIIAFGSISGFYGILDVESNITKFSSFCESELIRDIKIVGDNLYLAIGDYYIIKCELMSLKVLETINYDLFNHNELICPNIISFLDYDTFKNSLKLFISYFPTIDSKKFELEMTQNNKHPTFIKELVPEIKEIDFSNKFIPKNYSVPMNYKQDKIVYILREVPLNNLKGVTDKFEIIMYDFSKEESLKLNLSDETIKLIKLFKGGIIYVKKYKNVYFYDFEMKKEILLYNHSYTIVTMACDENIIGTIDKQSKINIYDYSKNGFICNDINFNDLEKSTIVSYPFFEMEYPYFSIINKNMFVFTIDFGIVVIDINKQFLD